MGGRFSPAVLRAIHAWYAEHQGGGGVGGGGGSTGSGPHEVLAANNPAADAAKTAFTGDVAKVVEAGRKLKGGARDAVVSRARAARNRVADETSTACSDLDRACMKRNQLQDKLALMQRDPQQYSQAYRDDVAREIKQMEGECDRLATLLDTELHPKLAKAHDAFAEALVKRFFAPHADPNLIQPNFDLVTRPEETPESQARNSYKYTSKEAEEKSDTAIIDGFEKVCSLLAGKTAAAVAPNSGDLKATGATSVAENDRVAYIRMHPPGFRANCTDGLLKRDDGAVTMCELNLSESDNATVVAQELGHLIEARSARVHELCAEFLRQRTANDVAQKLKDLHPGAGYDDDEITWKDKFINSYSGKIYRGFKYTEVLSMGIQHLLTEGDYFLRHDPEHAAFTLAILRGLY